MLMVSIVVILSLFYFISNTGESKFVFTHSIIRVYLQVVYLSSFCLHVCVDTFNLLFLTFLRCCPRANAKYDVLC